MSGESGLPNKAANVVPYPSPYANLQKCVNCHVLLDNAATKCPICNKEPGR